MCKTMIKILKQGFCRENLVKRTGFFKQGLSARSDQFLHLFPSLHVVPKYGGNYVRNHVKNYVLNIVSQILPKPAETLLGKLC